jgi:hypothetical protein
MPAVTRLADRPSGPGGPTGVLRDTLRSGVLREQPAVEAQGRSGQRALQVVEGAIGQVRGGVPNRRSRGPLARGGSTNRRTRRMEARVRRRRTRGRRSAHPRRRLASNAPWGGGSGLEGRDSALGRTLRPQAEEHAGRPWRTRDGLTPHGQNRVVSQPRHAQQACCTGVLAEVHQQAHGLVSSASPGEVQGRLHGLAAGLGRQLQDRSRLVREIPKEHVARVSEPAHGLQESPRLAENAGPRVRLHRLVPPRDSLEGARSVQEVALCEIVVGIADQEEWSPAPRRRKAMYRAARGNEHCACGWSRDRLGGPCWEIDDREAVSRRASIIAP